MKKQKRVFIPLLLFVYILFWGAMVLAQDWTAEQKKVWAEVQAN